MDSLKKSQRERESDLSAAVNDIFESFSAGRLIVFLSWGNFHRNHRLKK